MRNRHPGFTLIELMISLAVTAFVTIAIFATVRTQQQAYADGQRLRAAQSSARNALLFVEQRLSVAGLGVSPALAFDFNRYAGPCPATMGGCPRDAVANSDEIVFHARNPAYWVSADATVEPRGSAWNAVSVTSSTLKLRARAGDGFKLGQVVQAVCGGASEYAYFTLGENIPPLLVDDPALQIQLLPVVSTDPFRRQDLATTGCFSDGTARLFLVDRYRFHVRPEPSGTGTNDPYLVLDTGTDNDGSGAVDQDDELIVAAGIESIQFAYGLANGSVVGDTPGAAITFADGIPGSAASTNQLTRLDFPGPAPDIGESVYSPTSWYTYTIGPPPASQRLTDHQANIRWIRISIVGRSLDAEPREAGTGQLFGLNQNARPTWSGTVANDGLQRVLFESRVAVPNMLTRGMTYF